MIGILDTAKSMEGMDIATSPTLDLYSEQDFPRYLPKLNLLYSDLFQGGKGFRAKLVGLIGQGLGLETKAQKLLAQTIEFIHNASLLHDDLVDRSQLRRGKPTAWLKYTPEYAVLAGDYLLARVMVNLSEFGNITLVQYTAKMISDLLEGEWLQDALVGRTDISLDELNRVHILKTASLFKWCLRAPFIVQNFNDAQLVSTLESMGHDLGLLFQRSDDLLDFDIRNGEKKLPMGDLKAGYFNSFAAFACKNLSALERQTLGQSRDISEFTLALGGTERFQKLVTDFDQENLLLIDNFKRSLNQLSSWLSGDLIAHLQPLTEILYWRN